jgi:hypothetical protein
MESLNDLDGWPCRLSDLDEMEVAAFDNAVIADGQLPGSFAAFAAWMAAEEEDDHHHHQGIAHHSATQPGAQPTAQASTTADGHQLAVTPGSAAVESERPSHPQAGVGGGALPGADTGACAGRCDSQAGGGGAGDAAGAHQTAAADAWEDWMAMQHAPPSPHQHQELAQQQPSAGAAGLQRSDSGSTGVCPAVSVPPPSFVHATGTSPATAAHNSPASMLLLQGAPLGTASAGGAWGVGPPQAQLTAAQALLLQQQHAQQAQQQQQQMALAGITKQTLAARQQK